MTVYRVLVDLHGEGLDSLYFAEKGEALAYARERKGEVQALHVGRVTAKVVALMLGGGAWADRVETIADFSEPAVANG